MQHYYKYPSDMMELVHHYDTVARMGPKIFVGEWATRSGTPTPNFGDALGDAAWMTSMERNSDLIVMASLCAAARECQPRCDGVVDRPDRLRCAEYLCISKLLGTVSFAEHLGDGTARSTISAENKRFFYSATASAGDKVLHLKLVNASSVEQPLSVLLTGVSGPPTLG